MNKKLYKIKTLSFEWNHKVGAYTAAQPHILFAVRTGASGWELLVKGREGVSEHIRGFRTHEKAFTEANNIFRSAAMAGLEPAGEFFTIKEQKWRKLDESTFESGEPPYTILACKVGDKVNVHKPEWPESPACFVGSFSSFEEVKERLDSGRVDRLGWVEEVNP